VKVAAALFGCLVLVGCATPSGVDLSSGLSGRTQTVAPDLNPCSRTYQTTVYADRLTVGVSAPLVEPYFIDAEPTSGEGFEAGVVYGIAAELGLPDTAVEWQTVSGDVSPLEAEVDFIIDRRPPAAGPQVRYSTPYYQAQTPYAFAFAIDNPLIDCVDAALNAMAASGELDRLTDTWLAPDARTTDQ
jgi:hypothetical protein